MGCLVYWKTSVKSSIKPSRERSWGLVGSLEVEGNKGGP